MKWEAPRLPPPPLAWVWHGSSKAARGETIDRESSAQQEKTQPPTEGKEEETGGGHPRPPRISVLPQSDPHRELVLEQSEPTASATRPPGSVPFRGGPQEGQDSRLSHWKPPLLSVFSFFQEFGRRTRRPPVCRRPPPPP